MLFRSGADLADAIRWALAHPAEVIDRIEAAQRIIATRYSPEMIGRRWHEVFGTLRAQ